MLKAFTSRPTLFRILKWGAPLAMLGALATRAILAMAASPGICVPNPTGAGHSEREAVFRAECGPRSDLDAALLSLIPRYWTPEVDLSGKFSERIRSYVREQSELKPEFKKVLEVFDTYLFQYRGYREWNGRKVVDIFAFCNYEGRRITTEMLEVSHMTIMDGGYCVMHLEYDVKTDTFSRLFINGEA